MTFSQSLQYLKDRIIAVEKELKDSSESLRSEMKKKYNVILGLLMLESIPTMQALGIPIKEVLPGAVKLLLGFLHL